MSNKGNRQDKMTRAQRRAIKRTIQKVIDEEFYSPAYRFKILRIEETDYGRVIVITETGRKGDEGTMAQIICRSHRFFSIGPRGGIRESSLR